MSTASDNIDALVARSDDWRGAILAEARRAILEVDPSIVEEWKYMGAPVWSSSGTLIVGNIFATKVKLGFLWGASLPDPQSIFNGELGGNQRRSVEFVEGDAVPVGALQDLVREAIRHNREKNEARAASKRSRRSPAAG
ncbi:DUF1801 domain-containing protein [Kineococcus gynurae]|uniref:DUF1801 domain-containing protein n=1 Tax=Kineococcus gynurae TaxID=452979 RepID=A0ABV5LRE8_9ACTN